MIGKTKLSRITYKEDNGTRKTTQEKIDDDGEDKTFSDYLQRRQ